MHHFRDVLQSQSLVLVLTRTYHSKVELFLQRYRTCTSKYQKTEPTSFISYAAEIFLKLCATATFLRVFWRIWNDA